MTAFIILAALLAVVAVLFVVLPLVRTRASKPPAATAAMIVALGLIGVSAILYSTFGNPGGIRLSAARADSTEISVLRRAAERAPRDLSAWLKLGEAYGRNGQYTLALRAYRKADAISGGRSADAQSGIGEALLLGSDGSTGAETEAAPYFERALKLDPRSPKGLFYGALIAYRTGHLDVARARFATMLTLTPPPPQNVQVALRKEIAQIDAQLHPRVDAATAIRLRVSLAPKLAAKVPPNASLFVFVQGKAGGPPLAVKRLAAQLPQEVELSADDAMIAANTVHPGQRVTVVARISTSGSPLAQKGDLYGEIQYVAGKTGPRPLQIDRLSP